MAEKTDEPRRLVMEESAANGQPTSPNGVVPPMERPSHQESYQARALFRKTLSYQKRQMFTNICCIGCCPLLMVLIAAILGSVIQGLIDKSTEPRDIIYCSSLSAFDSLNFPKQNDSDPSLPKTSSTIDGITLPESKEDTITHVNYLVGPSAIGQGGAGALGLTEQRPCVNYFGSRQYQFRTDDPYAQDPQLSQPFANLDSTYSPQPRGGWLSNNTVFSLSRYLIQYQLRPWLFFTYAPEVNPATLGSRPPRGALPVEPSSFEPLKNASVANGLLDTIEGRAYVEVDEKASPPNVSITPVPWYIQAPKNMDDMIGESIQTVIDKLSTIDKHILFEDDPSDTDVARFLTNVSQITKDLPYGGIHFSQIDHNTKNYAYTFHIGRDKRLDRAAGFPQQGLRQVLQQAQLSNALLRFSNVTANGASIITQSTRAMPWLKSTRFELPIASFIGRILFPFGVSFLLPFFVVVLVTEKEDRIFSMMRMNGLKAWTYWLAHYCHFYSLHILSAAVFLIAGRGAKMNMFTETSVGVLILIFFMWGHAQVALSFFFGSIFARSRTALVISFLVILCSVLVSLAADALFEEGAPSAYFIWPPFAFYRILAVVNTAAFRRTEVAYSIDRIKPGDEVFTAIMFLVWEWFVLMGLAIWIGGDGWKKLMGWFGTRIKMRRQAKGMGKVTDEESPASLGISADYLAFEDADVTAERARVMGLPDHSAHPLVLKNLQKTYPTGKTALKTLTLAVEPDLVFGLLGPNGAGKSTTISILTGLYDASGGEAFISGYDVASQRQDVWRVVGVCPQHDILWADLTCLETVLFYTRLKGVPKAKELEVAQKSLRTVALDGPFKDRLTKGLSGGEKRRLSIAIALVADPRVVFLDEPTTGLDPEVRRLIWNIIHEARVGKTIILTTHSMEEAEVLCQRIGIMSQGTLRCLGSSARLKSLYANSFRLSFAVNSEAALESGCAFVESILPTGWTKEESYATQATYAFPKEGVRVGEVFEAIEEGKTAAGIAEWGVGETTLEEVFVRIIGVDGEEAVGE